MELAIERAFDVLRNIVCLVFSPFETLRLIFWWFFLSDPMRPKAGDLEYVEGASTVPSGDSDASPKPLKRGGQEYLNTDARTCQDIITSLGYENF